MRAISLYHSQRPMPERDFSGYSCAIDKDRERRLPDPASGAIRTAGRSARIGSSGTLL